MKDVLIKVFLLDFNITNCFRSGDGAYGVYKLVATDRHASASTSRPRGAADRRREWDIEARDPLASAPG